MSSYLNIYLIDNKTKEKRRLYSCSRNSDLYRAFNENLNVAYYGENCDTTELRIDDFLKVIADLNIQQEKIKKQITEYEKYAVSNTDLIANILGLKEELANIKGTLRDVEFLKDIFLDCTSGYTDFEGICINVN